MRPKAGQTQRTAARATHGSYGKPGESQGEAKRSEEEPPVLLNLRIGRKHTLSVAVCPSVHLLKIDAPMRELDRKRALAIVGHDRRKEHAKRSAPSDCLEGELSTTCNSRFASQPSVASITYVSS